MITRASAHHASGAGDDEAFVGAELLARLVDTALELVAEDTSRRHKVWGRVPLCLADALLQLFDVFDVLLHRALQHNDDVCGFHAPQTSPSPCRVAGLPLER